VLLTCLLVVLGMLIYCCLCGCVGRKFAGFVGLFGFVYCFGSFACGCLVVRFPFMFVLFVLLAGGFDGFAC